MVNSGGIGRRRRLSSTFLPLALLAGVIASHHPAPILPFAVDFAFQGSRHPRPRSTLCPRLLALCRHARPRFLLCFVLRSQFPQLDYCYYTISLQYPPVILKDSEYYSFPSRSSLYFPLPFSFDFSFTLRCDRFGYEQGVLYSV